MSPIRLCLLIAVLFLSTATSSYHSKTTHPKNNVQQAPIPGATERVSVSFTGEQGNGPSEYPSISADGRYVAFNSFASNLVNVDNNSADPDVFVRDLQTGLTELVSVSSSGEQGNSGSRSPFISWDGRYVTFDSIATNLGSGDTNGLNDIFVRDRKTGLTERVSVSSSGEQGNNISMGSSISADGRYVVFTSYASNLVKGDTNGGYDVFVRDRQTGITERVSVSSNGEQGNSFSLGGSISADGRYVALYSFASNLVSGDTNGKDDIFVHDQMTEITERVSVSSSGEQGNSGNEDWPTISADGRYVVFQSSSSNLVSGDTNGKDDIFVHDRRTGITERVSVGSGGEQANDGSNIRTTSPSISMDGRYVVFGSAATNLVIGDTNGVYDVFVRDRQTGIIERASVSSSGNQGDKDSSYWPTISANGRFVIFASNTTNIVSGDTNEYMDVFVHNRCPAWICGSTAMHILLPTIHFTSP
jgi:Tol biopolymer transport system component